eukprot:363029-Chlamydomonas_euryale.AAC.5
MPQPDAAAAVAAAQPAACCALPVAVARCATHTRRDVATTVLNDAWRPKAKREEPARRSRARRGTRAAWHHRVSDKDSCGLQRAAFHRLSGENLRPHPVAVRRAGRGSAVCTHSCPIVRVPPSSSCAPERLQAWPPSVSIAFALKTWRARYEFWSGAGLGT